MASLASLLEDFRNYRGVQDWNLGRQEDQMLGNSEQARGLWQLLQGLGVGDVAGIGAIKAYHGSPHLFDKFDMSKIGTGEGAQAYGHGLYFAEHPETAKAYANDLINDQSLPFAMNDAEDYIRQKIKYYRQEVGASPDKTDINEWIKSDYDAWDDTFGGGIPSNDVARALDSYYSRLPQGHVYQTSLEWPDAAREADDPLGPQHFLDWDRPLSEQNDAIQNWLKDSSNYYRHALKANDIGGNEPHGSLIMNRLMDMMSGGKKPDVFTNSANYGAVDASTELMDYGIPGIRYLDQGSRGAGEGTANYVVFDDRIPRIVARNGVPVRGLKGIIGQ